MIRYPLRRDSLPRFAERITAVIPEAVPRWGEMNPSQMIAHLRRAIEISLGEVKVEDASNWLTRSLIIPVLAMPWPRGGIKAPASFFPSASSEFAVEREQLLARMVRFTDIAAAEPARRGLSPMFGWLTLETWTRLHGKHLDHHLRQFGV